ncbi:hypothetical protein DERF_011900 [Dermatophagoides farinae]|uniref:Uncharacterized protein n=1 Tax=Dermatophagoides farinae TaxID=6954 RepID=A0A922HRJ1_DERFA|nr:hypothetical protein DERF_011900 [Dermatophagoides farinae]
MSIDMKVMEKAKLLTDIEYWSTHCNIIRNVQANNRITVSRKKIQKRYRLFDGRYKACLVASGFQQQYNNNVIYIDTFGRPLGSSNHVDVPVDIRLSENHVIERTEMGWQRKFAICKKKCPKRMQKMRCLNEDLRKHFILIQDKSKREAWPTGQIQELSFGRDGFARSASIGFQRSSLWCPISGSIQRIQRAGVLFRGFTTF